jgi:hypothetical protein
MEFSNHLPFFFFQNMVFFNMGTGGESPQQGGSPQQGRSPQQGGIPQHDVHVQQANPMTKIAWGQLVISALNFVFSLLIPMLFHL